MRGYAGRILRVDLSSGDIREEEINYDVARKFIGGRGFGSKLLFDEIDPAIDPFDERNKLIIVTGPLTATLAPTGGRYMVVTKSPLTGTIACSNSGGYFGPELKFAGYDALIVEGKSQSPVYLWIKNGKVEIRNAEKLIMKSTHQTEDIIRDETDPDAKIASIGPAGEKLVRFSSIINDKHRAAGRSGVGAVMGSKNLKAIAVRGSRGIKVFDPDGFLQAVKAANEKIYASPVTSKGLPAYGTAILVNIINECGLFPTNNFQRGVFEEASKISGETMAETILIRNKACFACSIGCGRITEVKTDGHKMKGEGPEYENIFGLGSCVGVSDLEAIAKANYLCNELGIDPISAGATISCAMELFEKGNIDEKTAGLPLRFGDADLLINLIKMIGKREGFGDILAEGSYRMAERFGYPELSITVKRQELAAYDPRGAKGMGLGYATANRGACHLRSYTISPEILGLPEKLDPFAIEGKHNWVKGFQDYTSVVDSTGLCIFSTFAIGQKDILNLLNTATGFNYTSEEISIIGERIWNLERLFNIRCGFSRRDDTLPPRFLMEPLPSGAAKGQVVELDPMLNSYYEIRGWDENGIPREETLRRLGLSG